MLVFYFLIFVLHNACLHAAMQTYRAGVYAHILIQPPETTVNISRALAVENMMKNLRIYGAVASEAKTQGVKILVFPEDGINGFDYTRQAIQPYLEYIPDPSKEKWTPCKDPDRYKDTEIQKTLSCMAFSNNLYIVANMGDFQLCNRTRDPKCPSDGHYQFNTNVVYNPNGTLVARYHKTHLYFEEQFDPAPITEHIYFDTPFGRFGVFTCFDMLFKNPAIDLIEKYNITNYVFPTAWDDGELNKSVSLLSPMHFHLAFAMGMKVNILAANIQWPEYGFVGSGIYSGNGYQNFYYNTYSNTTKLVVADVNSKMALHSNNEKGNIQSTKPTPDTKSQYSHSHKSTSNMVDLGINHIERNYSRDSIQTTFQGTIMCDNYTLTILDPQQSGDVIRVCDNDLCCELDYEMKQRPDNLVAFGAFDGLHTYKANLYLQVCVLIQCAGTKEESCGINVENSNLYFRKFRITGNFTSKYVFPEVIVSKNGKQSLESGEFYNYQPGGALQTFNGLRLPFISAGLISRVYERD